MTRTVIILAIAMLAGGCVSGGDRIGEAIEPDWLERRDRLRTADDWRMEGRIALNVGRKGYNGTVSWEQAGEELDFRFRGPFGFGGFRIHGDNTRLRVKTTRGDEFWVTDPVQEMGERFGFSLPVYSMRYWILGVSDPALEADEVVGEDGLLVELGQGGWQVDFDNYALQGDEFLPGKLVMEKDNIRIRVVSDRLDYTGPESDADAT
jgi:outer membrane lipoprotein LolB